VATLVLIGTPGMGLQALVPFKLKGWRHLPDAAQRLAVHRDNLQLLMLYAPEAISPLACELQSANALRDRLPSAAFRELTFWRALCPGCAARFMLCTVSTTLSTKGRPRPLKMPCNWRLLTGACTRLRQPVIGRSLSKRTPSTSACWPCWKLSVAAKRPWAGLYLFY